MKIGFSFIDLASGGAQIHLVQLAEAFASRGHLIYYYLHKSSHNEAHCDPFLNQKLNLIAQSVSHPRQLLNCDIIQLDGFHSIWRKFFYINHLQKSVEVFHSTYSIHRSRPILSPNRVAVSRYIQNLLPSPTKVIHNGVLLPEIIPQQEQTYDLCILGRIHPVKNHLLFLAICDLLYEERGQLSALIIGGFAPDLAYKGKIIHEIEKLQAKGVNLLVTGTIPPTQIFHWLSMSKLQLITSVDEGFGRMAIEGMSCRLPVVANPVGGLNEIVIDGETGYFAELNDPPSFLQKTKYLLDNPTLRTKMGLAGRKTVKSSFSFEKMIDGYENFYNEILKN